MPHKPPSKRYEVPEQRRVTALPIARALRASLRDYDRRKFQADVGAGLVVGIVALPLSLALAIASGVPPLHGLFTAVVAGTVIALTGGSRHNVSGPTAAFVVLLAPIATKYGLAGLAVASLMAGAILFGMGLLRLGRLIQFIPHPVTTGFTAGIALVIATLQVKDFLGLDYQPSGNHYWNRVSDIAHALPGFHWADLTVGLASLVLLLVWPRFSRRVPAPLVAVTAGALAAWLINSRLAGASVATVGSRFGSIEAALPRFVLPWRQPGPGGAAFDVSMDTLASLVGPAFAIATLGAIESLLSAVVADGMAGTKHDPDGELCGQGLGNLVAPFFGGFAATGAIARTATNIRSGAVSPIAALVHALFVLVVLVSLAPLLFYLPMASMAALLLVVAWNMSDARHFAHMVRVAPRSDLAVLLICFVLTVAFDMVIAVSVGVVLAALLFMRRMAEISGARIVDGEHTSAQTALPPGVILYEVAGPLFFGAADKAMSNIALVDNQVRAVVLDMRAVPAMDVTGLVALESALAKLDKRHIRVVITGLQAQPRRVLRKAELLNGSRPVECADDLDAAVAEAARLIGAPG